MALDENPYEPPLTAIEEEEAFLGNAEKVRLIRLEHLDLEKGCQYIAIIIAMIAILLPAIVYKDLESDSLPAALNVSMGVCCFISLPLLYFASCIYRIHNWVKLFVITLALFGLILFPLGTLFSLWLLRGLNSPKGMMIFSRRYARVRRQTQRLNPEWSFFLMMLGCFVSFVSGLLIIIIKI